MSGPILAVSNVSVRFGNLVAVNDVSFALERGQTLGLVGESGSGKSTLSRAILQIHPPTSGSVRFEGAEITGLSRGRLRPYQKRIQMIFQDPRSSLDPRMRVDQVVGEPLDIFGLGDRAGRRAVVERLLAQVGLDPGVGRRFPHEFSGGQAQRIAIARALAMSPELIVADEPVSALDVSIQAQIINLLVRLRRELSLSMLFIAHDLAVVRHIADRVAVMYLGRIVEIGTRDAIFNLPAHPYTRALLAAVPIPDPAIERMREGAVLSGDLPSPTNVPSGCAFRTRCPLYRQLGDPERCKAEVPALRAAAAGQQAACHFLDEEGRAP